MKTLIRTLVNYNSWANQQVWQCIQSLTEEQFHQAHDYSTGSLYEQAYHLMSTDFWTLTMLGGANPDDAPNKEDYTTREAIWKQWQAYDKGYHTWLANATDEDLNGEIGFQETEELNVAGSRAEYLAIIENHSTNHRAQMLALIDQLGGDTCEMGMYFFIRDRAMKKLETA